MSKRSKASVDFQFLLGDALIKSGAALVVFTIVVGLFTPFTLREAFAQGLYGYVATILGFLALAAGLWQGGRWLRREATIAER